MWRSLHYAVRQRLCGQAHCWLRPGHSQACSKPAFLPAAQNRPKMLLLRTGHSASCSKPAKMMLAHNRPRAVFDVLKTGPKSTRLCLAQTRPRAVFWRAQNRPLLRTGHSQDRPVLASFISYSCDTPDIIPSRLAGYANGVPSRPFALAEKILTLAKILARERTFIFGGAARSSSFYCERLSEENHPRLFAVTNS